MKKLTQAIVDKTRDNGYHFDHQVSGLALRVTGNSRCWVLRQQVNGKRREIGLGSVKKVNLAQARWEAMRIKTLPEQEFIERFSKRKPIEPNNVDPKTLTFTDVAKRYEKHKIDSGDWEELSKMHRVYLSRMKCHILPVLGDRLFNQIRYKDVAEMALRLKDQIDTMNRCIQTVKQVFDWGIASEFTAHDNPALRDGALKYLLPSKKYMPENRGALSVEDHPLFMKALFDAIVLGGSIAFECGFFAILTATRSMTARKARWDQIDWADKEWIIPADQLKMSGNGSLIVPLAPQVIKFLKIVKNKRKANDIESELMFPNPNGEVMSDAMFSSIVKRLGGQWIDRQQSLDKGYEIRATMHGIARADFMTWAGSDILGNDKRFDKRIAELCLHHKVDNYNGAYERNKSMLRRREMMEAWAEFSLSLIEGPARITS